jgi:hypothetical protein
MVEQETLRKIAANAQLIIDTLSPLSGFALGYNEESVRYVEKYVLSLRKRADAEIIDKLTNMIGCYLGECIRHSYGGQWAASDSGLGISFNAQNGVYPFSKVGKLFEHGAEDSIVSFYTLIPMVFASALPPTGPVA